MGHLLEPVTGIFEPFSRWYRLTRKKSSDKVSGEVCLIIVVMPKYIYQVLNWSEDCQTLLDPQMLQVGESPADVAGWVCYTEVKQSHLLC